MTSPRHERSITPLSTSPPANPRQSSRIRNMMLMSCSIFGFASGFVIKSAGFTFVPTVSATNRPALQASCVHRFCISTCFVLPRPLRLTRHIVCEASKCRFNPHDIPMSFAMLRIPSPSDAVLTAAYSSHSTEDSDTTCCFLVHTLRQCPPLMMTPTDTDLPVALSPPNTLPTRHSPANGTSTSLSASRRSIVRSS